MFVRLAIFVTVAALSALPAQAAPVRPPEDIKRDSARKPDDMVKFAHVVPGAKVVDIIAGHGYFTRVFAIAVGPAGHVTAVVPPEAAKRDPAGAKMMADLAADPAYGNISVVAGVGDPALAGTLDVAWTAQNYHDLHNALPPAGVLAFNKAVLAALKPGGTYVIVDHVADAGTGLSATQTLHRIDPQTVRAEVTAAGFVFDGESTVLADRLDKHDKIVFDPTVRGFTDQFAYRFKKP